MKHNIKDKKIELKESWLNIAELDGMKTYKFFCFSR